tara:strand:- start:8872 stop:9684 length:813 start_codon:yes stop_codon:yes gene_type:complete
MTTQREFTQEQILNSKGFVKGMTNFDTPSRLFENLLNIEPETYKVKLEGSHEVINLNDDQTENVSFGRLNVQYKFMLDDAIAYNLGLIIALDKGKPIAKIYSGLQVQACLNMCIFNADQIQKFDISTTGDSYKDVFKSEFKKVAEKIEKGNLIINTLKSINLEPEKICTLNGAILENIIKNNGIAGTNPILNGIKLQTSRDSKYFSENGLNAWLYYNSLTEYLDKKVHILDIPEKALNIFSCVKDVLKVDFTQTRLKIEEPKKLNGKKKI